MNHERGREEPTRRRLRIESLLALCFVVATAVTAVWPDWIESVFGVDPDHGNGSLEWAIVVVLGLAALGTAGAAVRDYVRLVRLTTNPP